MKRIPYAVVPRLHPDRRKGATYRFQPFRGTRYRVIPVPLERPPKPES